MSIFPNPTSRDATISYTLPEESSLMEIVIIDEQGREMMQTKITHPNRIGNYSLNLNGYSAGIYFVKIVANGFSETKKLIVEKN
jgi:Secretion system C-terminal sorting domain